MDPLTIASTVGKIITEGYTIGKAIYQFHSQFKNAPITMVAIGTEMDVVLRCIVSPDIATTLDNSLTGCMVIHSCLDQEVRGVTKHLSSGKDFNWKGKFKTAWNVDRFESLLVALRGQELALNTLMQLIQMDSLDEIKHLLQERGPELRRTAASIKSFRSAYPAARRSVAETIFRQGKCASIVSSTSMNVRPSAIGFEFDDLVLDSTAYRRVFAEAKRQAMTTRTAPEQSLGEVPENDFVGAEGDLISFSDTKTQHANEFDVTPTTSAALADLAGLRMSSGAAEFSDAVPDDAAISQH